MGWSKPNLSKFGLEVYCRTHFQVYIFLSPSFRFTTISGIFDRLGGWDRMVILSHHILSLHILSPVVCRRPSRLERGRELNARVERDLQDEKKTCHGYGQSTTIAVALLPEISLEGSKNWHQFGKLHFCGKVLKVKTHSIDWKYIPIASGLMCSGADVGQLDAQKMNETHPFIAHFRLSFWWALPRNHEMIRIRNTVYHASRFTCPTCHVLEFLFCHSNSSWLTCSSQHFKSSMFCFRYVLCTPIYFAAVLPSRNRFGLRTKEKYGVLEAHKTCHTAGKTPIATYGSRASGWQLARKADSSCTLRRWNLRRRLVKTRLIYLCITSILWLIGWTRFFLFALCSRADVSPYFSRCFPSILLDDVSWCLATQTFLHSVMFGSSSRGRLSSDRARWVGLRRSLQGLAPPPCRN